VKGRAGEDLVEKQNAELARCQLSPAKNLSMATQVRTAHGRIFPGRTAARGKFQRWIKCDRIADAAYLSLEKGKP
jgi:hypothetical protein